VFHVCEGKTVLRRSEEGESWDGGDLIVVFHVCEGEMVLCRSEEGESWNVEIKLLFHLCE